MSQQFTYYSNELCQIHQEPCTNMCINTKCLQPLCPECIEIHFREHKECQIESLKSCRTNCSKKIRSSIQEMNQILSLQEMKTIENSSQYIELCRESLQQLKQQIIDKIDSYNKKLLQDFSNNLIQAFKESQIKEVYNRIKNLIQQLDELGTKLETQSDCQIKTIRSIYLLNTTQLIQSSNQEAYKELLKLKFPLLVVSQNFNQKLDELFGQSIQIQFKKTNTTMFKIEEKQQLNNQPINIQEAPSLNQTPLLSQISEIQQGKKQSEFAITVEDYLLPSVQNKVLHYFKYNSKELNLINLDNPKEIKKIKLQIPFQIPVFHQSIITKTGQLYLIGGTTIDNNYPNTKSNAICLFDKYSLANVGHLLTSRSSHGCCIVGDYIYSISGFGQNQVLEKTCERYNYILRKSEYLQDCLYPSIASCCVNYNNQFIYKFGGLYEKQQMNFIERFNIKDMIWQAIDPQIANKDIPLFKGLKQFAAGVQISPNSLMIFGGYDENSVSSDQSFLFTIKGENHILHMVNSRPLKIPGGFWHQQCMIYKQELFVVQNQENKDGETVETKTILRFKDRWLTC
ncbi:unnamed protein product (macronuclear) [Paramecium tetraurelia]|uniref:B box-type domain-containing protein n=1 Tax=Paramecium tetraurelia TaxID=5888 RepID=A0CBE6_PARTE|nr:uncharacterized protein GSPATT00036896001 [Paramecium tetraurelia]CAK68113.1 unnamed protein product [Paramecium tetraurelia]|eukprot:XP_001435510.1 hypothetical protein (macronuclear) [Paramecium tetraurelia strain d4-2]